MRWLLGLILISCLLSGCNLLYPSRGVPPVDKRPKWQKMIDPRARIFYDPDLVGTHPGVI
jgi:hypothetical protein